MMSRKVFVILQVRAMLEPAGETDIHLQMNLLPSLLLHFQLHLTHPLGKDFRVELDNGKHTLLTANVNKQGRLRSWVRSDMGK